MLANMTHEAFPRVMDYFAEGDGFYLVMELIRGKDLSELLEERNAPFETAQVLEWADQILDALEDLHSQDIVHRDIKPSNLKLTPRGRIKLLDFGIAKGVAGDMTALQSTVGSMAAATLQYAPLEQVLRADTNWLQMLCVNFSEKTLDILDRGTDARSDLYALGATLYHLLTNTIPVNAPTRALAVWSGQSDKVGLADERFSRLSLALTGFLRRALELDPKDRFASPAEMRLSLKSLQGPSQKSLNSPAINDKELVKHVVPEAIETPTVVKTPAKRLNPRVELPVKPVQERGWLVAEKKKSAKGIPDRLGRLPVWSVFVAIIFSIFVLAYFSDTRSKEAGTNWPFGSGGATPTPTPTPSPRVDPRPGVDMAKIPKDAKVVCMDGTFGNVEALPEFKAAEGAQCAQHGGIYRRIARDYRGRPRLVFP